MQYEQLDSPHSFENLERIKPADIVVTRSHSAMSKGIQIGTCSIVSHAMLMVDEMTCIEAIGGGVKQTKLSIALNEASGAFVLRHMHLSHVQALGVVDFVQRQLGAKYDAIGATRSAASSGCRGIYKYSPIGIGIIVADFSVKALQGGHDKAFYCSELVARAFEAAGAKLSSHPSYAIAPGVLLESKVLTLVKVLK